MPFIEMVSSQPALWCEFMEALEKATGIPTRINATGEEVVQSARTGDLLAVILDQGIARNQGLELVRQLLSINAMIHVAWASEMAEDEFHEATEGLGILMQLSPQPDVNEARLLAERLCQVSGAI